MEFARILLENEDSSALTAIEHDESLCVCSACPSETYDADGFCTSDVVDTEIDPEDTAEGSIGHWIKIVIMGAKICWLTYSCTRAIMAYSRKEKSCLNFYGIVFTIAIIIKLSLIACDIIGAKYIVVFFAGTFTVNYFNFIGLMYILRNLNSKS